MPICALRLRHRGARFLLNAFLRFGEICNLYTIFNCIALARLHTEIDLAYFQLSSHSSSLIEIERSLYQASLVFKTTYPSNVTVRYLTNSLTSFQVFEK